MNLGGQKKPVIHPFFFGTCFFGFAEVNGHDMKNFKISSLRRRQGSNFSWKFLAAQSRAAFFSATKNPLGNLWVKSESWNDSKMIYIH